METQFKKGQSRNPEGRPKVDNEISSLYKKVSNEIITIQVNGVARKVSTITDDADLEEV